MVSCSVRPARTEDAPSAVAVIQESISQLCVHDHQNDAAKLARWLLNKTTARFRQWLADPQNYLVVASRNSICGVGLLHAGGEIRLCYVKAGDERSGVGRAILAELEARARVLGLRELRLNSSATARGFYERAGYVPTSDVSISCNSLTCYPYRKELTLHASGGEQPT